MVKKQKSTELAAAVVKTELTEGETAQKKSTTYKRVMCTIWIALISFTVLMAYCIYNSKDPICNNILKTFKNSRSAIFIIMGHFGILLLYFILFWKAARKLGLFVFYIVVAITIAVLGRVVDYVTRSDVGHRYENAHGHQFGDYGIYPADGSGYGR